MNIVIPIEGSTEAWYVTIIRVVLTADYLIVVLITTVWYGYNKVGLG